MDSSSDPAHQQEQLPDKIVAALEQLNHAFRVLLWEKAQQHRLSPIQIYILVFISSHSPQQSRVGNLAREFGVTAATISDAVTTLESKKLLARIAAPEDRRAFDLKLTAAGRRLAKKLGSWADIVASAVAAQPLQSQQAGLLFLMNLISTLQKDGLAPATRICLSCKHLGRSEAHNQSSQHYCNLLGKELADSELRVDCPIYERRH